MPRPMFMPLAVGARVFRALAVAAHVFRALAVRALAGVFAAGAALAAHAAPDATTRESAATLAVEVCGSCHGPEGRGDNPRIPRLAAQQRAYIEAQLKAFRSKSRGDWAAHESMWPIAARLSDDVVAALADYFAAQKPAPAIVATNRDAVAKGRKLFDQGSPERGLPACTSCHGAGAEGQAVFPRLAGQHGEYLFIQMQAIRNKLRASPVMHGLIKELTDDEIVALAAYLEAK